ncbi:hypothetical protein KFK09_000955 [Dendrobium nobile]|uniref:Uncharacterized protein n=1 Tax=Dendrobium nobile TaxID=94219 RepID=A0A8T3CAD9_DENNO|nr:hypothetical protein KFK09_000955 [Dendrobium nobile]
MATQSSQNLRQNIHGIILRTLSTYFGRYAYFPLPRLFPTTVDSNLDNIITDSLINAPHYPDITILDSISSNILYQTYSSFPNFFHVYNLINRSHISFSFPHLLTFITAAILTQDSSNFKVLVVCINEHPNPLFVEQGNNRTRPLVFYLYSSETKNWSPARFDYALTSDHLLPNRRKPIHLGEDIVFIDLTNRFLITYAYWEERVEPIPKLRSSWEQEETELDEATRFDQCMGQLHCVKYNPINCRIEMYSYMRPRNGKWTLVVTGNIGSLWGKVMAIHPDYEGFLLVRSPVKDAVLMVDIRQDYSYVVIKGRGPNCSPDCFVYGMNDVLEASTSEGLQRSSCGILHPHENIEGTEGEIFIVSHFETPLISLPQNLD